MNQSYPVPPPELVDEWFDAALSNRDTCVKTHLATQATQWGADQELEACCQALRVRGTRMRCMEANQTIEHLRASRRPKPLSLKEQALKELRQIPIDPELGVCASALDTIRRALEALND